MLFTAMSKENTNSAMPNNGAEAPASSARRLESRLDYTDAPRAEQIRRDPPKCMSVLEAASYVSIHPRTLRRHIADRRITTTRLGGRIVIRLVDLERDLGRFAVPAL